MMGDQTEHGHRRFRFPDATTTGIKETPNASAHPLQQKHTNK
jgi:hypothetical protein